jgi:peptidoglycan-associated lipoprotein
MVFKITDMFRRRESIMNRFHRGIVVVGFVCGLLAAGGCRNPKSRYGDGDDMLIPEDLDGGIPMEGGRFGEGTPVKMAFAHVKFAYDSFQVANTELSKIEAVASYLKRNPKVRVITEGHCDERGSREYNMSLGEHRALAVRAYLVEYGIDQSRIQTRSFGEESPIDAGHNESSWRLNRRVEFALYR